MEEKTCNMGETSYWFSKAQMSLCLLCPCSFHELHFFLTRDSTITLIETCVLPDTFPPDNLLPPTPPPASKSGLADNSCQISLIGSHLHESQHSSSRWKAKKTVPSSVISNSLLSINQQLGVKNHSVL